MLSKSLASMTEAELEAWVTELQGQREALRAEGVAKKKEREAKGLPEAREARKPREKKASESINTAEMLAFLKGE